jgi:CRP-like cAMP-binding protein
MSRTRISQVLADMAIFSGLNPRERELLAMVMRERVVQRGEVICEEGDEGTCCYFIAQGVVEVRKRVGRDAEQVLVSLRDGQLFGHLALVEPGPRTATCLASTTCRLLTLERDDFDTLFASGTRFAFKFQEVIAITAAQQLRLANERLSVLLAQTASGPPIDPDAFGSLGRMLAQTDTQLRWDRTEPPDR